jgi:hypothetical protein
MSANEKFCVDWTKDLGLLQIDDRLHAGLAILWRAYLCTCDTGAHIWELSLPVSRLYDAGMTSDDLRWLLGQGFAEHGEETTNYGDVHRSFHFGSGYFLNPRSCLILTSSGAALVESTCRETGRLPLGALPFITKSPILKPHWDARRRELTVAGSLIKRYRVPARNQETILSVFEEEGWAEHIHDPLPATLDIDAPTRLHDAINRLNRSQINPLVRFHGDGKGTGVFWELLCVPAVTAETQR